MRPSTSLLARLALGLCLAWAGISLAREVHDASFDLTHQRRNTPPAGWRFGMPPVERLQRCLAPVESLVPRDALVVFASPPGPLNAEFFRWRWAAYLLPHLNVTTLDYPEGRQLASYLITFGGLQKPPPGLRLELVRRLEHGGLYRILRP